MKSNPLKHRISYSRLAAVVLISVLSVVFCSCKVSDNSISDDKSNVTATDNDKLDFSALKEKNADIYCWLEITDSDISVPVLRHDGDNSYYLSHNADGRYSITGAVYTEDYNSLDFEDPVTVIYGKSGVEGAAFNSLEADFTDFEYFESHRELKIYLPDSELTYKIFAAVPYSNTHLLYYYDFSNAALFDAFFQNVLSVRSIQAVVDKDIVPDSSQNVVILSTSLASDSDKRFLVFAVR